MKRRILTLLALAAVGAASAHDEHAGHAGWGHPAAGPADRVVEIRMGDDMRFRPARIEVRQGETVRIVARNTGRLPHEWVLGTAAGLREHAAAMRAHPGMAHADASALQVPPGEARELAWTFDTAGRFSYACLLPGHYEAGMRGSVRVVPARHDHAAR